MLIANYTGLFEIGVGLFAVSGFINENLKKHINSIKTQLDRIYETKETMKPTTDVTDFVEEKLDELYGPIIAKIKTMEADAYFFTSLTVILMLIPIGFLYAIGVGIKDVDNLWGNFALFLSVFGGAIIVWCSRILFRSKEKPIVKNLKYLQRCITLNKILDD